VTTSGVVPLDGAKVGSPEYVAVTVSAPTGAAAELHEPVAVFSDAGSRGMAHKAVAPTVTATEPVGTVLSELTEAEYVTVAPLTVDGGTPTMVVVDGSLTVSCRVLEADLPNLSVTVKVTDCEEVAAGTPEINPDVGLMVRLAGSAPGAVDHE
jgi:hypothetical protein